MLLLSIAGCGAVGAVARYSVSAWVQHAFPGGLPWGTLLVNVLGCFLLGALMEWELLSPVFPSDLRLAISGGFLGAFTTFSTFGYETLAHLQKGHLVSGLSNIAANVLLGLLAVAAGIKLMRIWLA